MAALKSVGGSGQRNLCLRVLLLCLVLTAVASRTGAEQSPSPGGRYYALLIGQAASPGDGLEAMAAVENDLRGFKTMLEGMTATPYRIRVCMNPDRAGIVKAMNTAFREAGPEDLCLIYYGGHGKNSAVEHRRALMVGADGETLAAAELQEAYLYTHAMTTGVSGAQHPQADPLNSDVTLWSKERSQEE